MRRYTIADLWHLDGWERYDNDSAYHRAAGILVTKQGTGQRPWRVLSETWRSLGGQYATADSAAKFAMDLVFDRQHSRPRNDSAARPDRPA